MAAKISPFSFCDQQVPDRLTLFTTSLFVRQTLPSQKMTTKNSLFQLSPLGLLKRSLDSQHTLLWTPFGGYVWVRVPRNVSFSNECRNRPENYYKLNSHSYDTVEHASLHYRLMTHIQQAPSPFPGLSTLAILVCCAYAHLKDFRTERRPVRFTGSILPHFSHLSGRVWLLLSPKYPQPTDLNYELSTTSSKSVQIALFSAGARMKYASERP